MCGSRQKPVTLAAAPKGRPHCLQETTRWSVWFQLHRMQNSCCITGHRLYAWATSSIDMFMAGNPIPSLLHKMAVSCKTWIGNRAQGGEMVSAAFQHALMPPRLNRRSRARTPSAQHQNEGKVLHQRIRARPGRARLGNVAKDPRCRTQGQERPFPRVLLWW
jgi:hypothetical protein